MSMRIWALVAGLLWATAGFGQSAHSDIVNAQGQKIGTAQIRPSGSGIRIDVKVSQLTPGMHGIHVHDLGKCEGPASPVPVRISIRLPNITEKIIQKGRTLETCSCSKWAQTGPPRRRCWIQTLHLATGQTPFFTTAALHW